MCAVADLEAGLTLAFAVSRGNVKQVDALLSTGAPLDVIDSHDKTALMWAATQGYTKLITKLLNAGADPNQKNLQGHTALMYAATHNRHRVLSLLINAGADVNAKNFSGESALDAALRNTGFLGNSRSKRLLLKAGAKRSRKPRRFEHFRKQVRLALVADEFQEWKEDLTAIQYIFVNCGVLVLTAVYAPEYGAMGITLGGCIFLIFTIDLLLSFPSCLQGLAKLFGWQSNNTLTGLPGTDTASQDTAAITDVEFISGLINDRSHELRNAAFSESVATSQRGTYNAVRYGSSTLIWLAICFSYLLILVTGWENPDKLFGRTFWAVICVWIVLIIERRLRWRRLKRAQEYIDAKAATIGGLLEQDDIRIDGLERGFGVYLRPFVTTNRVPLGQIDLETLLAYSFVPLIPIIALGRPGEHVGAGRIETSSEDWKEKVSAMLDRSELILCIPSARAGTLWELEQLKIRGLLDKTVFIMPRDFELPAANQRFGSRFSEEWQETVKTASMLGLQLPNFQREGLLFKLGPDGQILALAPLAVIPLLIASQNSGNIGNEGDGDDRNDDGGDGGNGGGDGGGGSSGDGGGGGGGGGGDGG